MSLQINIGNRPVNAKLTIGELKQAEKDEKRTEIVDNHIKQAEGYTSLGELSIERNEDGSKAVTITEDMLKYDIGDLRERRKRGLPVKPVFFFEDPETGESHYLFTDRDAEGIQKGYICENCWGWQKDVASLECETIRNFKCGFRRRLL